MKPSTWSLLEAIKSLLEFAKMPRKARINIPRRLLHINMFLQNSMKRNIFNIKLVKRPSMSDC